MGRGGGGWPRVGGAEDEKRARVGIEAVEGLSRMNVGMVGSGSA